MKTKLLIVICFLLQLNVSNAQKHWRKPYLLIENKSTGKYYTIKPRTNIYLKTKTDSIVRKVKYQGIASNSSIYIQNNSVVNLSDIDCLSFRPFKYERTTKHLVYAAGIAITVTSFILLIQQATGPQVEGTGNGMMIAQMAILVTPPLTILSAYIAGNMARGLTPFYFVSQGETCSLKIVKE